MSENPKSLDRFDELAWNKAPYIPKLRPCLTRICENPCEAMLLDFFYTATQETEEYMESEEYERCRETAEQMWGEYNRWGFLSLRDLDIIFCSLFDENQIYDAILSLTKRGWVDFKLRNLSTTGDIAFYAHTEVIDQALLGYSPRKELEQEIREKIRQEQEAQREADEKRYWEIREEERAINLQALADERKSRQIIKETEDQIQRDSRERKRITHHIGQDRLKGRIGTLTLTQWLETLNYFNWKCAYCQGSYEVLEHFLPVTLNGTTNQDNCVPACGSCNRKKNNSHPSELKARMGECIERVQQYLSQFRFEHT